MKVDNLKSIYKEILRMTRYFAVGISASLLDFLVFKLSLFGLKTTSNLEMFGQIISQIWLANAIAVTTGFIYSFLVNRSWSFKSKGNIYVQFVKSTALFIFNIFASGFIITKLVEDFNLNENISKLIAMAIVVIWNYVIYKKFIYK